MPKVSKVDKTVSARATKEKPAKEKKEKDPNAPKRPLGAYMFFCQAERSKVKTNFPDLKATEIASKLGALWKDLDDKAKEKFNKQAEADKERYKKEVEAYNSD